MIYTSNRSVIPLHLSFDDGVGKKSRPNYRATGVTARPTPGRPLDGMDLDSGSERGEGAARSGTAGRRVAIIRRRVRPLAVGFLLLAIAVLVAGTARAAGDRTTTLRRAVGNVLLGPFDVALSPVVTAQGVYESSRAAGYSVPTTAVLELIGGAGWYLPVTAGTGIFRIMSGFGEIPVGLALLVSKSF